MPDRHAETGNVSEAVQQNLASRTLGYHSPLGCIALIAADPTSLSHAFFTEDLPPSPDSDISEKYPILARAAALLDGYFSGLPLDLSDIPVIADAGTDFQNKVWRVIRQIPYGETRSYTWIAEQIGRPKAVRAVGNAVGANPVTILTPCHRVIRSSGALGGYGGGLPRKRHLLALEGHSLSPSGVR